MPECNALALALGAFAVLGGVRERRDAARHDQLPDRRRVCVVVCEANRLGLSIGLASQYSCIQHTHAFSILMHSAFSCTQHTHAVFAVLH
jgi:hypothetical protein